MADFRQIPGRVEYEPGAHDLIFREVLTKGEEFFVGLEGAHKAPNPDAWASEFAGYWLWNLQWLAPFIKHPSFDGEREWRFVYTLGPDDIKRMQLRQRQSMMRRHVALRLVGRLPIAGVRVGPCRHPLISRIAVGDLLEQNGYDPDIVKVEITKVPYRAL
jgi:hypothetical protein